MWGTAKIHYYNIDNNSKRILKWEANSLFSWEQPDLPEDLCFIKGDNAWIPTFFHEGYCDISSDNKAITDNILKIEKS